MRPRLVASDLDGTLLRSDGSLSPRTARVLRAVEEVGVDVVYVTARPPEWVVDLGLPVGEHGTVICANGAFVLDVPRREVVEEHVLEAETVTALAAELRRALPAPALAVQGPFGLFVEERFQLPWPGVRPWRTAPALEALLEVPVGKLMVQCHRTPETELVARVTEVLSGRAVVSHSGVPALAEVSAPGVTKATTLARWCAARGVDRAEVWAFGDMPNDLEMLTWAGRAFAVAGAHPQVLQVADEVVPANDEDGVAAHLEAALLGSTWSLTEGSLL